MPFRRERHPNNLALIKNYIYNVYTLLGEIMSSNKARGKDKKKSSQLVIRVEKAERDAFVALCDRLDTSAAREIRQFMREQVAAQSAEGATSIEPAVPAVVEVTCPPSAPTEQFGLIA